MMGIRHNGSCGSAPGSWGAVGLLAFLVAFGFFVAVLRGVFAGVDGFSASSAGGSGAGGASSVTVPASACGSPAVLAGGSSVPPASVDGVDSSVVVEDWVVSVSVVDPPEVACGIAGHRSGIR